jgi:hypothetical protein
VAVLIEMLLFRTFSRTGIYLLNEDTPLWVYQTYRVALWLGNAMYNFAAILVVILMLVGAAFMFSRQRTFGKILPALIVALVAWSVGLIFVSTGPLLTVAYLALSTATLITAIIVTWTMTRWPIRVATAALAASFLCVYYFETIAPLRLSGFTFTDHGLGIFQIGEALVGVGIVAAFWAWGRTRKPRHILPPLFLTLLIVVGYIGGAERYPLVSTWSMGVIMSLPFYVYVVGIFLLSVTMMKLVTSERRTVAFALLFMVLTHRMLPLTYFNLLLISGFVLVALSAYQHQEAVDMPYNATENETISFN